MSDILNYLLRYHIFSLLSFHRIPKWSAKHDTVFGPEILSCELWKYRPGTRERGNCLNEIWEVLNDIKGLQFCVSQKSLRDSLKILERDSKARKREAERGSGISPEYHEINQAPFVQTLNSAIHRIIHYSADKYWES